MGRMRNSATWNNDLKWMVFLISIFVYILGNADHVLSSELPLKTKKVNSTQDSASERSISSNFDLHNQLQSSHVNKTVIKSKQNGDVPKFGENSREKAASIFTSNTSQNRSDRLLNKRFRDMVTVRRKVTERLRRSFTVSDEISGRIFRHGPPARLTRDNISIRESDIAAIFKGVAYGPATESAVLHSDIEHIKKKNFVIPASESTITDETTTTRENVGSAIHDDEFEQFSTEIIPSTIIIVENENEPNIHISTISPSRLKESQNEFATTIKLLLSPTYNTKPGKSNDDYSETILEQQNTRRANISPYPITESATPFPHTGVIHGEPTTRSPWNNLLNSSDILSIYNNSVSDNVNGLFPIDFFASYKWDDYVNYVNENIESIWVIYMYTMAVVFGIVSLISFHRLFCRCNQFPFFLHFSIYIVLFVSSLVRATIYLWNPYSSHPILPELVQRVLYVAAEPCVGVIMSSFIVLLLNVLYGMIILPVIIAFLSAAEMASSLLAELALKYLSSHVGHLSQNFLTTVSFTTGMLWNGIICLSYIMILNGKRFRQSRSRRCSENLMEEGRDVKRKGVRQIHSNKLGRYLYVAAFAQFSMIAAYVYTLLHPKELLIRTEKLKPTWVYYQILGRTLEFIVYICLLPSCSLLSEEMNSYFNSRRGERTRESKYQCCTCCSFSKNCNTLDGRYDRKSKCPVDVYTLNPNEEENSVAVNDFQLVWNRSRGPVEKPKEQELVPDSEKDSCSSSKGKSVKTKKNKVKKLKSLKERNEIYISIQESKRFKTESEPRDSNSKKKTDENVIKSDEVTIDRIDIHTNSSDMKKYESVRNKFDISGILNAKLPPVDESMYKYMGVTAISSTKKENSQSNSTKRDEILKEEIIPNIIDDTVIPISRSPQQFWSPQHKPPKSTSLLAPMSLKVHDSSNLPSKLTTQQIILPHPRLPLFIGHIQGNQPLTGSQQDLTRPKIFHPSNYPYTPTREFIKDFMSSRPSGFSGRFSSADLATTSSHSEMRVDYLTDLSSADGRSLHSISRYSRASRMSMSNISDQLNYY